MVLAALAVAGCLIYIHIFTGDISDISMIAIAGPFTLPFFIYIILLYQGTKWKKPAYFLMIIWIVVLYPVGFLGQIFLKNNPYLTDQVIIILFILCLPAVILFYLKYPSLNALTDNELADPKKRTFMINLPYDNAFRLCLRSLQSFPFTNDPAANPARGTIFMELEGTRYSFSLHRINSRKTEIVISAIVQIQQGDGSGEPDAREAIQNLDQIQEFCEENQNLKTAYQDMENKELL